MKIFCQAALFFLFLIIISAGKTYSQDQIHKYQPDQPGILQQIDNAYNKGNLSVDQRVLYKLYAITSPENLPSNLKVSDKEIIKCGTPAHADYYRNRSELSSSTIQKIESLISGSTLQSSKTYQSTSGNFTIHYTTSGEDAVPPEDENQNNIPDYVEEVAEAADSSYSHEAQNLGYTDPIPAGENYHIEILNLENFYGQTLSPGNYGGETFIQIENDFSENFPPNDDPEGDMIGAIKVTIAHELKHAIQYANNKWQGSAGNFNWSEMDATLMEEVVYDNVNDYYNYLSSSSSIFNTPSDGVPGAYWHVSWSLFFEEYFGSQFWVDVWKKINKHPQMNFLTAIEDQVLERNESFNHIFAESYLWHLAAGPRLSPGTYGFEERTHYPSPSISASIEGIQQDASKTYSMNDLGSRFFEIRPRGFEQDQLLITISGDTTHFAAAAIAYFTDGSTEQVFQSSISQSGDLVMKTPWNWKNIEKVGVAATNLSKNNHLNVGISTESYRAEFVTLKQNFPNPFSDDTIFRFFLLREMDVELKIYDITGRLVYTIIDEELTAGPHEIPFSGNRLASGVYIYQLVTDRKTLSRKMTIIN